VSISFVGISNVVTGSPTYNSAYYPDFTLDAPPGNPGDLLLFWCSGGITPFPRYSDWVYLGWSFYGKIATTKTESVFVQNDYVYIAFITRWKSDVGFLPLLCKGPNDAGTAYNAGVSTLQYSNGTPPTTRLVILHKESSPPPAAFTNGFEVLHAATIPGGSFSLQARTNTSPFTNLTCTSTNDIAASINTIEFRDATIYYDRRRYAYVPPERSGLSGTYNATYDIDLYSGGSSLAVTGATANDLGVGENSKSDASYFSLTRSSGTSVDYNALRMGHLIYVQPCIDPQSSSDHKVWARLKGNNASGDVAEVGLYQKLTPIAIRRFVVTNVFADYSFTLTAAEADLITDYRALGIRTQAIV
jgi:hypothetical protein